MMNRKLMISVIAVTAATATGLGSAYAAAGGSAMIGTQIIGEIETEETETEETETETETEETGTSETDTTTSGDPSGETADDSLLDSLLSMLGGRSEMKSAEPEAYVEEGYMDNGLYEADMLFSAEEAGGAYYAEPAMPSWNTEEYNTVGETGFRDVRLYPLSTFGMDVDTASYALLRRNTLDDTLSYMPKDAVRIEEMINYFNYDYDLPEGDETFHITAQITDCPWNDQTRLMLIGLQAKDIPQEEIKAQNLVFLVDTSGSMYDADKLPLAIDALKYLLKEMDDEDSISIVTYAGSSEIALEPTKCTKEGRQKITKVLDSLTADGGTYGEAGIRTAYELAQKSFIEGGNNRVLLLTDGDFNLGQTDDSELVRLVQDMAKGQIFLSILGFGSGNYNDALAEELADKGNGNYSYVDSDMEARRVMGAALKGTLNTVAKDAKVQVDFNPAYIKGYRLVGYENRLMNAEEFEDDTKDGGEVGAGQQVTVLYELVTTDSDMELPTAHSRYTTDSQENVSPENTAEAAGNTAETVSEAAGNMVETAGEATGNSAETANETAGNSTETVSEAAGNTVETAGEETGNSAETANEADGNSIETSAESAEEKTDGKKARVSLAIASEEKSSEQNAEEGTAPSGEEYLTVSIRYKDPEGEKSQLKELAVTSENELDEMSDNMSWAAGVAQIGMLLRDSEYAGTSDYGEVRDRMKSLTEDDEFREEFIYLISRLKGVTLEDDPYTDWDDYYAEW